jgi:xylulose-5-phosphate/fructose-6-phosphate phosphoketolase
MADKRIEARQWTRDHGDDLPEVAQWQWPESTGAAPSPGHSPSVTAESQTSADQ